jgi:hypothetical protein
MLQNENYNNDRLACKKEYVYKYLPSSLDLMNNLAINIPVKSHMIKIRQQISLLVLLLLGIYCSAQKQADRPSGLREQADKYTLLLQGVDMDSATIVAKTGLQTSFISRFACEEYINRLSGFLQSKGFVTSSIDSLYYGRSWMQRM